MKPDKEKLLIDVYKSYEEARRDKRNKAEVIEFEIDIEKNIYNLCEKLYEQMYEPLPSKVFIVEEPVKREVFAAQFSDRIVHHLLVNYIGNIFEKRMIEDSYSCRKEKGTLYGIERVEKFIRQCSQNYQCDAYIMKLDIEGFFMNIHRPTLLEIVKQFIHKYKNELLEYIPMEWVLWLASVVIMNDPTKNCIYRSSKKAWNDLPQSKSLFYTPADCGLPIGNLTSQLFANVYLNGMDWYIKEELKIKFYGRYVDDFVLIHTDKEYLMQCREKIDAFLRNNLRLQLHRKKFYLQHYSKGVKFLGAYIKPYCKYAGNRIKTNFIQCVEKWNRKIESGEKVNVSKMRCEIQSYWGMLKHYNSYNLQQKIIKISHPLVQQYAIAS